MSPEKSKIGGAADQLAAFAAQLAYDDLPAEAVLNAKLCLIDSVACAIFGTGFPWSRAVIDLIALSAATGGCAVPGFDRRIDPRNAALAFGTFAHAFEHDSLRKPGVGAHPGATVALPAFAVAQAGRHSGRDLVVAIVAGCETSFRIGAATLHTPELDGFHAPGIVGPFGSTVASAPVGTIAGDNGGGDRYCGLVHRRAFGVCRKWRGRHGQAVASGPRRRERRARRHPGGARGYEGPRTILDGKFGILDAFCSRSDPALLTARLGEFFEITRLCIKRYACHVTAQAPIELLRTMIVTHGFRAAEIAAMKIVTSAKVASHHNERRPADVMLGQYSIPFSLAVAAWRDPEDPMAFAADCVHDREILDLAACIELAIGDVPGWGADLSVTSHDGRNFAGRAETFRGCPEMPMSIDDVAAKFRKLTGADRCYDGLLQALLDIESVSDVGTLEF